jgi:hypothetical protein
MTAKSWMTAAVLDALLFTIAKSYPHVCFMSCQFSAYDLPNAVRARGSPLSAFRCADVLGRPLSVVSDAIGPIDAVAGYDPLPTSAPRPAAAAAAKSAGAGGAGGAASGTKTSANAAASAASQLSRTLSQVPRPWASVLHTAHQPGAAYTPTSYSSANPTLVFFSNVGAVHWTLVRVDLGSRKRIEVYEPFGMAESGRSTTAERESAREREREGGAGGGGGGGGGGAGAGDGGASLGPGYHSYSTAGLSLRSVPKDLLAWLDAASPLPTPGGWRARSRSAITRQQQANGWDCGVAGLLYAEKIGMGLEAETICKTTDQEQISAHRSVIMSWLARRLED